METTCQHCGKPFKTYPSRIKRGDSKFCSKACYNKSEALSASLYKAQTKRWENHTKTERVCKICNKVFYVSASTPKHHPSECCSPICRGIFSSENHRGENHHNWTGGKIAQICITCGKQFEVKQEQVKRTGAKFCSLTCRSIYNVRHCHGKVNTDIELIMGEALTKHGIEYNHQEVVGGIATVDFFVKPNIVIECDGDYWHNLPKQIKRDNTVNRLLEEGGYKVFRFKGSEIKASINDCIKQITVESDV